MTAIPRLNVLLMMLCLALSACAQSATFGAKPQTDRLSQLVAGQSKPADILLALGEPRGKGASRFGDTDSVRRDVWFYEYVQSDGSTVDLKMLLVFIRDDTYDGHLWFSSVDVIKDAKGVILLN